MEFTWFMAFMGMILAAGAYGGIQQLNNTIKSLEQRLLILEQESSDNEIA